MGKQSKRKNKRKGGGNGKPQPKISAAPPSKSTLINRIRHGDLRIRHGALTAASATIFSPESLSKSTIAPINMELIQAMSERVMDDDAPCAMCALGCLGNYILFQDYGNSKSGSKVESLLTPIMLTKMNKASDQVEILVKKMMELEQKKIDTNDDDDNNNDGAKIDLGKKQKKKGNKGSSQSNSNPLEKCALTIMEQYSIQSLALHVLCGIIESTAANNESSSILYHQKTQFLSTILRSFLVGTEMITALNNPNESTANNQITPLMKRTLATKENQSNIISDVVTYSARSMHSACDDNPTFMASLQSAEQGWNNVIAAISNATLPTLARLHCCGITIVARQINPTLAPIVIEKSLPLLSQFTLYSSDIAMALHKEVSVAQEELMKQKQDENMENDIIRVVDKRKESARTIARRQKELKKEREAKNKADADTAAAMETDATAKSMGGDEDKEIVDGMGDEENQAKIEAEEKFEKALNGWKNACLPLKLSVEIITNMCSIATGVEGDNDISQFAGDDDMDDMGWDSDQEEKLLAGAQGNPMAFDVSKDDQHFFRQVVSAEVPDRVLAVFGSIFATLVQSGTKNETIHQEILDDLTEVLGKCSICLGNVACSLQHSWKSDEQDAVSMWNDFRRCLVTTRDNTVNGNIPISVIAATLSTMGAMLRFRPSLVKSVSEPDLDLILSFVLMEASPINAASSTDSKNPEYHLSISDIQKEAIGMLGILCSETHPDQINEKICTVFLTIFTRLNTTTSDVICEVLNALMDMYSSDEGDANNHEGVFRKKGVLDAFQKTVPNFKRKIRDEGKKEGIGYEEVEFWNETALNATRFIKYKKQN